MIKKANPMELVLVVPGGQTKVFHRLVGSSRIPWCGLARGSVVLWTRGYAVEGLGLRACRRCWR